MSVSLFAKRWQLITIIIFGVLAIIIIAVLLHCYPIEFHDILIRKKTLLVLISKWYLLQE